MTLKLGYWTADGIVAPIRMLLHALGQEYENITYAKPADWTPIKQKRIENGDDFMNLPFLEDGDTLIRESGAIPYYLCQKFNKELFGKNALDTTRIIQIEGVVNDIDEAIIFKAFVENPKEALTEAIKEETKGSKLLASVATFLGDKEFLLGYLTYADLKLAYMIHFHRSVLLCFEIEDPFLRLPNLLPFAKRVFDHDLLKGYLDSENHLPCLNLDFFPWFKEHPLP